MCAGVLRVLSFDFEHPWIVTVYLGQTGAAFVGNEPTKLQVFTPYITHELKDGNVFVKLVVFLV